METLTREVIGFVERANVTTDFAVALPLNLARGNAAILNEVRIVVEPRPLLPLTGNAAAEGRVALGLDAALLGADDLPVRAGAVDADVGEGRGLLDMHSYAFHVSAQQDTTNNNASAIFHGGGSTGLEINYRQLPMDHRPMTTEDPEMLGQLTFGDFGINVVAKVYYQIVRLTQSELGRLSGDIRPTVLRVATIPESGGILHKQVW